MFCLPLFVAYSVSKSCYLGEWDAAVSFCSWRVLTLVLLGTLERCLDFGVLSVHSVLSKQFHTSSL